MPVFTPISNLEIILGLGAFVANTYLGLAIFLKNPKSWTNRLFALLALVLNFYIIVNPPSLHPPLGTPENQFFWVRMVIVVASFIGPLLFLLVCTFPKAEITLKKRHLILISALALATAFAAFNSYIFESISYLYGKPIVHPGKGIILFLLDFPLLVIFSFVAIIQKFRKAKGSEKIRLAYFMLGIFGTFSLMVISTVTLVLIFKTAAGIFLGPIFPVILTASVAFAIMRHQFLDIKPIIIRAVSFLVILFAFAIIYAFLLTILLKKFNWLELNRSAIAVFIALNTIAMLSFQMLDRILRRFTNRLFFKGRYNQDKLLAEVTRIMAEIIELDDLIASIASALIREMRISKLAFLLVENHKITELKGKGYDDSFESRQELEILFHNPFTSIIDKRVVFDDLTEGELKEMFRKHDISIAVPVKVENNEVALLIAGSKLSGEPYSTRDVDFLSVVASETGIAIQNAKAFAEIKKFSKELEKKVEERTQALKKVQERELAKANEVSRLKDEFVFIAAHELRTPVTVIKGFLELVSPSIKRFPKDVQHHLNAITLASNNLNQLINDLLETARSESGELKIAVEPVDVAQLIKTVIVDAQSLADEKKVKIEARLTEALPKIMADPIKVREILANLLSNAIKYNREGGNVNITALRQEETFIIEVHDTGYGIPKVDQEKIFQKFSRVPTKETRAVLGTGLGLFISRMLVEKMGGKISFSSTPGKGTTFAFSLPIVLK